MAATHAPRPPAFFWQGALIMLPVAVLAVVCLVALRQDERAAESEARNRAAENVQGLGRAMRGSVADELQRFLTLENVWMIGLRLAGQPSVSGVFPEAQLRTDIEKWERDYPGLRFTELALPEGEILADGRQIEPPDFPAAPEPPKWFLQLTPAQKKSWETLRAGGSRKEIEARRQEFLNSTPADDARQAAPRLFEPPEQIVGVSSDSPTETGISFEEIACYQLLAVTNAQLTQSLLQGVWWHTISHSSMLSPKLLDLAGGLTNRAPPVLQEKYFWLRNYFNCQSATAHYLESLRQLPDLQPWKTPGWSHWTRDGAALGIFEATTYVNPGNDFQGVSLAGRGYGIWLVPRVVVEAIFRRALAENKSLVPEYAVAAVSVAGVPIVPRPATPVVDDKSLLGVSDQTAGTYSRQDAIRFQVGFFLTSRELMLSAERRRARLFSTLVLGAALTAFIGLLAARHAFQRQCQLNEQKSNFVSSVSHELRAPIASVRLLAENLERGKIPEPARQGEYFRFIVQECRRLSSLIENVLDFSRIEQGRKQYEFEPTNIVSLVEATVQLMGPGAAEKGVTLKLETSNLPATANLERSVDGRAIQQALVNLIDNAVKHSPPGAMVTVGIEMPDEGLKDAARPDARGPRQSSLKLFVADQGKGIPAAEHERIFERFYRRGSELRRETQGIGIGLSLVKHIAEAHGGRVRVQSQVGRGSRFTIELPVFYGTHSDH
jgi:signal transduction histidine kinase